MIFQDASFPEFMRGIQATFTVMLLFFVQCISPSGTSLLKPEFLICLKGVKFAAFYFAGVFFLREQIFADRGQSAKSAKMRTREIFMLHGNKGRRRSGETIVLSKRRVPCGIETGKVNIKLKQKKKRKGYSKIAMVSAIILSLWIL